MPRAFLADPADLELQVEYIIIEVVDLPQKLARLVNDMLAAGWELVGGPFTAPLTYDQYHSGGQHPITCKYMQAMIKRTYTKKTVKRGVEAAQAQA